MSSLEPGACIKSRSAGSAYTKVIGSTGTEGPYVDSIYGIDIGIASTCIGSVDAIEHSEMNIQFFQNLEFGDNRLEILVKTSCIKTTCISYASIVKHFGMHL